MAVNYVVRDTAGSVRNGTFPEGDPSTIYVSFSRDVSLNLGSEEVASYTRVGTDLQVVLQDGSILVLDGYFDEASTGPKNLFLSEDGALQEVFLGDADEGLITPTYAALDTSGKWSGFDELVFLDIDRVEPVVAPLLAPALGGLAGLGPLAAGGAALAGAALLAGAGGGDGDVAAAADTDTDTSSDSDTSDAGGDDDGGDGGDTDGGDDGGTSTGVLVSPTVNDADATQIIGGTAGAAPVVSGTGVPGTSVTVTIGDKSVNVDVNDDGTWVAPFDPNDLPADGVVDAVVTAPDSNGDTKTLDGPTVDIDTTPPVVVVTSGTQSVGEFVNAATQASTGAVIGGTGEAGATLAVTIDGTTHETTVAADGTWTVTFSSSEISTGDYEEVMTIVSTDARGNATTINDVLDVDTLQSITLDATVGGDATISGAEQAAGVTFTGTADPGSTVVVTMGAASTTVTANSSGAWSASFASGDIPEGTYDTTVTATATDRYGNTASTSSPVSVDTETSVAVDRGQAGGDDIISQAEMSSDITLTGTAEVGSSVVVTVAGVTRTATVDGSGNWSAVFESGSLPGGEYDTTITAVATDAVGNSATSTAVIRVDTVAGDVALSSAPIEIDDVINFVERSDGVEISGTATPGLVVTVTLGAASTTALADASGNWATTFPASDIPTGTDTLNITASITDAVGNSKTVSDTVNLDTEVTDFTISAAPIESDGIINAAERSDGVTLTGTVEPGSTVVVTMGSATSTATVDASGNWSATFLPGSIPEGEYTAAITVEATDAAGNVATLTDTVDVDTSIGLTSDANQTADDVVNAAERDSGLTLSGTADPGSTVSVVLEGVTRAATVDASGNWTASFATSEIPEGTYTTSATITATDAAGNTASVTESFAVDTQVETPDVDSVTFVGSDVRRISTQDSVDSYEVNTLDAGGTVGTPVASVTTDPTFGTELTFASAIPDGTNLVVTRTDDAGNSASTMVVFEDDATTASTLGHAGAGSFDIAALNLEYGEDASLVLTEAEIKALSDSTDTLTIHGGNDDTVTVTGAVSTGATQTIDGQDYDVYTIGTDGATLVIDQDVNVII